MHAVFFSLFPGTNIVNKVFSLEIQRPLVVTKDPGLKLLHKNICFQDKRMYLTKSGP